MVDPGRSWRTDHPGHVSQLLDEYIKQQVKLTADEHKRLQQGEPVTKMLPSDASKEVAVFGAVWINAPVSAYIDAVKDIEQLEKGSNFLVTKKISSPRGWTTSTR